MVTRVAGRSPIPREIELKLAIDPGDVPRLRKSLALDRVGPGKATRVISTYYDTPSLSLLHNAIALRLRTVGHHHVQSIKIDSDSGRYPARRAEVNNAIPNGRLNLRRVEDHAVRHLIEKCCKGKKLKPVFLTNVMREIHLLELGRSHIECAIDRGFVTARGKKAKICELELELKSGEASSLLNLARRLNANTPLRIEPASKAARGYALVNGAQLVVPKANAVHLDATMSAKESLTAVMRSCLTHVIGSADYAFKSNDPEGIHQLRVAIRRTRAAFSIIRRHVAKGLDVRVARDLRSLQQKLGGAREWDVLVEETLKFAPNRLLSAPFSAHLGQIVKTKRAEGHKKAHAALQDYHCTDLLLRLAYWIDVELIRRRALPQKKADSARLGHTGRKVCSAGDPRLSSQELENSAKRFGRLIRHNCTTCEFLSRSYATRRISSALFGRIGGRKNIFPQSRIYSKRWVLFTTQLWQ